MSTSSPLRVLILGGTAEARELAALLDADDRFAVVSSLAGRVRDPRLPVGETRIGGFGGVDRLADYLRGVDAVIDATHPFAATISANAAEAATRSDVPLLGLVRPEWTPSPGDHWTRVPTVRAAAAELSQRPGGRAFITTGRQDVHEFAGLDDWWFLIRVVDEPSGSLPQRHRMLRSRGPYGLDDERALLREHGVELVVTKNSGGHLVSAKLAAARDLGLEVIVVERPERPSGVAAVASAGEALDWLIRL